MNFTPCADETNSLADSGINHADTERGTVYQLADTRVVRITRVRLVGWTRGFPQWDLSYCLGELADGTQIRVDLGRYRFTTRYRAELVEACKQAKRFGKNLGIFEAISTLPG